MRLFHDRAAEFVPTVERVFGRAVRVVDAGRAVQFDDVKLRLEAGESELWIVRVAGVGLEHWESMVELKDGLEPAVREAKERLDG